MLRRIAALSRSNWPRPLPRPIVIGYVSRDAPTADASPPRARADVITLIRSPGAAIASVCVLVAGLLAGCSTSDGVGSFIIDPGHYSVYHCDGLAARLKVLLAREQELANLMNRAGEGGGGVLIGNLAYRTDYENAVGEEKVLRRAAAEKKCELPPPAQPVSSTPAPYATQPAPATAPIFQSDQTIR